MSVALIRRIGYNGVAMVLTIERISKAESKSLDRILKPFEQAVDYLAEHYCELVSEYDGEWVAVYGDRVVAHIPTRLGLRRKLTRLGLPTQPYVAFLTSKKRTLIL